MHLALPGFEDYCLFWKVILEDGKDVFISVFSVLIVRKIRVKCDSKAVAEEPVCWGVRLVSSPRKLLLYFSLCAVALCFSYLFYWSLFAGL